MRNLLSFILRYHFFFIFALLETFSVILVVKNHSFQHSMVINGMTQIAGAVDNSVNNITEYFRLKDANQRLAEENARLRAMLPYSKLVKDTLHFSSRDTVHKQMYEYIPAKVISNSVTNRNNYIMLNKGLLDGIRPDMAVICPDGIVGIVSKVSQDFSWVISILHKQTKISARIKKNGFVGSLAWDGNSYHTGQLKDIPANVQIKKGDTIVTSGYSHMFPAGIMIGTIKDFKVDKGFNFYEIELKFSTDFNRLSYVYVVTNLKKEEQANLERFVVDE